MTATVINIPRRSVARIECSACGATQDAACDCGVPYVPAGMRAAQAVTANPEKSDRAIAEEIGVDHKTVGKARKSVGDHSPPEKRVGKDGKSYPAKPRRQIEQYDEPGIEDDIDAEDPENYRTAYLLRVDQALRFATYSGPITKEIVAAARNVAGVWSALARKLEKSL